jgi:hypothetical protein
VITHCGFLLVDLDPVVAGNRNDSITELEGAMVIELGSFPASNTGVSVRKMARARTPKLPV